MFNPDEWLRRRAGLRERALANARAISDGVRRLQTIVGDRQMSDRLDAATGADENTVRHVLSEIDDIVAEHKTADDSIARLDGDINATHTAVEALKAEQQEHEYLSHRLERLRVLREELRQAERRRFKRILITVGSIILIILAWRFLFHG
jgi:hypothetical protein